MTNVDACESTVSRKYTLIDESLAQRF